MLTTTIDHSPGHLIESLAFSGTDIEDSAYLWMIKKIEVHPHGISDIDKIPLLQSRLITPTALKQLYNPFRSVLVKKVPGDRCHPSLVIFPWPIDIKVSKAHYLGLSGTDMIIDVAIKEPFGEGVGIEWMFIFRLFTED